MTAEKTGDVSSGHWQLPVMIGAGVAMVVIAWFSVSYLVGPPVPRTLTIATGASSGVYHDVAVQYLEALEEHGIELQVLETQGSVENLDLLHSGEATLAIVQGGTGTTEDHAGLSSLASLYLEPVWVFYRADFGNPDGLTGFQGGTIAVGAPGSGARAIAAEWLAANGFERPQEAAVEQVTGDRTTYAALSGAAAANALEAGDVDAAFFVVGAESSLVSRLVRATDIRLLNIDRAVAYETRYRYLKQVTFAEGMLDLDENLPAGDVALMATTANLVANEDLHPALIQLLLQTARDVHDEGGFFAAPREFPSSIGVDIPINAAAKRYFRDGPSFLYRYLPFRWANWLDRMKLLLAPMIVLLIPLFKLFPPVYRFRIRRRIYRWYHVLREIDQKLKLHKEEHVDFTEDILRLGKMESELAEVSVPLSYMEEFYNLRLHVNYVLGLMRERCQQPADATGFEDLTGGAGDSEAYKKPSVGYPDPQPAKSSR